MSVEKFHQLREIRQRPGQPVYFVDHHIVYPAGGNVGQEAPEIGAVQGGA